MYRSFRRLLPGGGSPPSGESPILTRAGRRAIPSPLELRLIEPRLIEPRLIELGLIELRLIVPRRSPADLQEFTPLGFRKPESREIAKIQATNFLQLPHSRIMRHPRPIGRSPRPACRDKHRTAQL